MAEQAWTGLPEPVRARLAEVASVAVGELPAAEVPPSLRRLSRFTPGKRARLGARALVGELSGAPAFRAAVLAWWQEHRPGELGGPEGGPVGAAVVALLAGSAEALALVAEVSERGEVATLRSERDEAVARVDKLTAELDRVRAELAEQRAVLRRGRADRDEELERLRGRYREQGGRLRQARDEAEAARGELAALRRDTAAELVTAREARDRARSRAETERDRATRAGAAVDDARQAARDARQADDVRLELLLDTVAGAVLGLRRELALGPGERRTGPRPADLVDAVVPVGSHRGRAVDATGLDRLLGLPLVHLVVDGYNVSKTGYPELALFDQRARLISTLGTLAARTGAEITVVFDGAAVVAGPVRHPRGVRVLFSRPGVLADDVIRELVAAEPAGRPVLVVSSDRAVATSVRGRGAHPVESAVLLELLGHGGLR